MSYEVISHYAIHGNLQSTQLLRRYIKYMFHPTSHLGSNDKKFFCYQLFASPCDKIASWTFHELSNLNDSVPFTVYLWAAQGYAFAGRLDYLKALEKQWPNSVGLNTIAASASAGGQLEILKWLETKQLTFDIYCAGTAATNGQLEVLQWLNTKMTIWNTIDTVCSSAAHQGHIHILQWAKSLGITWSFYTLRQAASAGQLETLLWLKENTNNWDPNDFVEAACYDGHLHILKWLKAEGCTFKDSCCIAAVEDGHLKVFKWLIENGCQPTVTASSIAAREGHMEILKFMNEKKLPMHSLLCDIAAQHGRLQCLKWLKENGFEWTKGTTEIAVDNGCFDVLQYAAENGCAIDVSKCVEIAEESGRMDIKTYLVDKFNL